MYFKIPVWPGYRLTVYFRLLRSKKVWTRGVEAKAGDGKHVVFLDYDGMPLEKVADDVDRLQLDYNLGRAYIFNTGRPRGWHAVIPEVQPLWRAERIVKNSQCDESYVDAFKKNYFRTWILRVAEKGERAHPEYETYIEGVNPTNVKSGGHLEYLRDMGVPEADLQDTPNDGGQGYIVNYYRTSHY